MRVHAELWPLLGATDPASAAREDKAAPPPSIALTVLVSRRGLPRENIVSHCHNRPSRGRSVVFGLLTLVGVLAFAPAASADPPPKVTICHATGSVTNPYVQISISQNAIAAHEAHQDRQDIIPATSGCVPPPLDVCNNIDGVQTSVPEGMVSDGTGGCVTPIDVCTNLLGNQATVPAGYVQDLAGLCVPIVEGGVACVVSTGVKQTTTTVTGTPQMTRSTAPTRAPAR